jgi:hypothetical protein
MIQAEEKDIKLIEEETCFPSTIPFKASLKKKETEFIFVL